MKILLERFEDRFIHAEEIISELEDRTIIIHYKEHKEKRLKKGIRA